MALVERCLYNSKRSDLLLPLRGPHEEERGERVVDRGLSRSRWIPEELTGMHNKECASQPHLWGAHPPSLASLIPLADLPVIDTWKNYLAPVHKSQGAGMASSECEPMAA
ncbi:hypothetical protein CesoFtcFv8_000688 [Champsocephalus esox]|nr:hypothetical protein CesoFtcFv8_000688 [Champsocephalus esox]